MARRTSSIVVSIDGGYASTAALELALHEAELRGTHVRALVCWPPEARHDDGEVLLCNTHAQAADLLDIVVETVRGRHPDTAPVVGQVLHAPASAALVEASADADLLVLGSTAGTPTVQHHSRRILMHCLDLAISPVVVVPWTFDALAARTGGPSSR